MAAVRIELATHHFIVSHMDAKAQQAVAGFLRTLVQWKWARERGRAVMVPDRVYALREKHGGIYRFHINHYKDFCNSLVTHGIPEHLREVITKPLHDPVKTEFSILPHWKDRPKQVPAIAFVTRPEIVSSFIDLPPGEGKAQPLTAKIKVPGGFSIMGKMQIGTKVVTPRGTVTEVTGVFPQGEKDIFRVTFEDGRSSECCLDHLWKVKINRRGDWQVKSLHDIMTAGQVSIPLIDRSQRDTYIGNFRSFHRDLDKATKIVDDVRSSGGIATLSDYGDNQYIVCASYPEDGMLDIKAIEYIGKKEAQCISVADEEHLYVTDDYIVTHNTFCAFRAIAHAGHRAAIVVRPRYLERWLTGISETFEVAEGDVLVVQGSKHLKALLDMQAEGSLTAKFILFSNKTLGDWFRSYKEFGDGVKEMGYQCTPPDLFAYLGVGYRIIDEVHQDFHFNFLLDLYTNLPKSVSLSGTLTNDDDHVKQMMLVAYPVATRYEDHEYDRYIDVKAWFYSIPNIKSVRISEPGSNTYSHNAFEKSIMKQPKMLAAYLQMIKDAIDSEFVPYYKEGNKLLVFASTTAFCTLLTDYLASKYPNYSVKRYVGSLGDPEENLMDPVIRVSTLGSSGTAVDIPGLYMSLLTVAIGSSVSNIQGLGRTRKMKDEQSPKFVWLACQDVPQHLRYHERRRMMLHDRIRSFDSRYYNKTIG